MAEGETSSAWTGNQGKLKNILIVDDNAAIRRSLRRYFERCADWTVCGEAGNGREGIEQALSLIPDLIVMDLSMPVMNGFQAARELQRLLPEVPIVMLTTFNNEFVEAAALGVGHKGGPIESGGPRITVRDHARPAHSNIEALMASSGVKGKFGRPAWSLKIEHLRHVRKLNQAEFGAQLGLSAMAVSRWERGVAEPHGEVYVRLGNLAGDPLCW